MKKRGVVLLGILVLFIGGALFARWMGVQSEWLIVSAITVSVALVVFVWIAICTDQPNLGYKMSPELKHLDIQDTFRQTLVLSHLGKSVGLAVINDGQLLIYDINILGVREVFGDVKDTYGVRMDAGDLYISRLEDDSGFRIGWITDSPWLLTKE